MALTLRDVVENRAQQRASGLWRDATTTRGATSASRERFSVDTSDSRAVVDTRARTLASAKAEADKAAARTDAARADAAKKNASRSAASQNDRTGSDAAKTDAAKGAVAKSAATKSDASKQEPAEAQDKTERADPPASAQDGAAKPGKTAAVMPEGASELEKPHAAKTTDSQAEASTIEQAIDGGDVVDGQDDPAAAKVDGASTPVVAAMPMPVPGLVPPPVVAPQAPSLPAGTGGTDADAEGEAELHAVGGDHKGRDVTEAGPGNSKGPAVGTKGGFEVALADAGATAPPSATQSTDAASAPAGVAPASPAGDAKAATAAQTAPPTAPAPPPVPLGAVPMTIGLRALGESNRFEIRLDPKELGRIDVSIDIDKESGTVGARLVVERPETLALLQRDASSLQQALSQTGLDASAGVSLSLRGDGAGQGNGNAFGAPGQQNGARQPDRAGQQAATDQTSIDLIPLRSLNGLGRVDIRI